MTAIISYKVLCLQQRHAGIGIGIGGIGVYSRGALVSVSVSISFFSQILYRLSYRQGKTGIVTSLGERMCLCVCVEGSLLKQPGVCVTEKGRSD